MFLAKFWTILLLLFHVINSAAYKSQSMRAPLTMSATFRGDPNQRFIPSGMEARIADGRATMADLDRTFGLTKAEKEYIFRSGSAGYVTAIINLETAMIDLSTVIGYSLAVMAGELHQKTPSPLDVRDVCGSPLRDCMLSVGWSLPVDNMMPAIAPIFYSLVDSFLDKLPIQPQPYIVEVIDELIRAGNGIVVVSSLPRPLAVKALRKSRLSTLFEGRVSPENLLTLTEYEQARLKKKGGLWSSARDGGDDQGDGSGDKGGNDKDRPMGNNVPESKEEKDKFDIYNEYEYNKEIYVGANFQKWQLTKSCSLLRVPSVLAVYMDGNRRNLQQAKRMGLSTIAIRGFSKDPAALRAGDKVIDTCRELRSPLDFYKIVKSAVSTLDGPAMQQQTVADPIKRKGLKTLSVETPMMDNDSSADTFADEFGSDNM